MFVCVCCFACMCLYRVVTKWIKLNMSSQAHTILRPVLTKSCSPEAESYQRTEEMLERWRRRLVL